MTTMPRMMLQHVMNSRSMRYTWIMGRFSSADECHEREKPRNPARGLRGCSCSLAMRCMKAVGISSPA